MRIRMIPPRIAVQQRTIYKREESASPQQPAPEVTPSFHGHRMGTLMPRLRQETCSPVPDSVPSNACLSRTMAIVMSAINRISLTAIFGKSFGLP